MLGHKPLWNIRVKLETALSQYLGKLHSFSHRAKYRTKTGAFIKRGLNLRSLTSEQTHREQVQRLDSLVMLSK